MMSLKLAPADQSCLDKLLSAARPFLRITGADRVDWCRPMQDLTNGRIGPWKYRARFDALDQARWDRAGEVLYLVTDAAGRLRLVGQSMSRLNGRWKEAPMHCVRTHMKLGRRALFHTTAWPALERCFDRDEAVPYTVSCLFRPELQEICAAAGGELAGSLHERETHRERLSFHVESWVCSLKKNGLPLWNTQKT